MNLTLKLVFIAGILSIFSPCIFPLIPSYFAYLAGIKVENIKTHRFKVFIHAILFTIGFSSVLLLVGAAVGALGEYLMLYKRPIEIVGGIIKIGLNIVGLIFLALMIYGGFLWMTARGEEAKVTKSKELLEAAIIGLVIVFAAYGITYFVVNQLMTNVISGGGAV